MNIRLDALDQKVSLLRDRNKGEWKIGQNVVKIVNQFFIVFK